MSDAISQAIRARSAQGQLAIIAEIKVRGARGEDLLRGRSPAEIARVYRAAGATALSVVTSSIFGGTTRNLADVHAADLGLPILRKDRISTEKAIEASKSLGASAVLLVLPLLGIERLTALLRAANELGVEPFVEVATRDEIEQVRAVHRGIIAINNADIATGEVTGEGIARSVALIDRGDPRVWISASRVHGTEDARALAKAGFDGILIGTRLLSADDLQSETARIVAAANASPAPRNSRPLVKICGVTKEAEVAFLEWLGVDFFGLVVDVPSPWTLPIERAGQLAASRKSSIRPTLVTAAAPAEKLAAMAREIGARAIQLGTGNSPRRVAELRGMFGHDELLILLELAYSEGRFVGEDRLAEYMDAGADLILLDKRKKSASGQADSNATIPVADLLGFRERHPDVPIIVAGGVSAANARQILASSGAVGIDVCSSVRRDGWIDRELVAGLLRQISGEQHNA
jgi:indole-3-glycerol phosphate synthase